jgi:hypothetical protein
MTTNASTACTLVPAGYFKPTAPVSNVYYICAAGTYSIGGSTSCTSCASSTSAGATSCPTPVPTTIPSIAPTATPTSAPSASPTVGPTAAPTTAPTTPPSRVPSATPTRAPTAMLCPAGTYYSALSSSCVVNSIGYYTGSAGLTAANNCTSAVFTGASTCLSTLAYVSNFVGGSSTTSAADGLGTSTYWINPYGIALDSQGFAYAADNSMHTVRKISLTSPCKSIYY